MTTSSRPASIGVPTGIMSPLNPPYTTSNSSHNPDAESVYSLHSLRDSLRSASPASSIQSTEAPSEVDLEQYGIQSSGDQSFVPVADMEVLAHQLFSVEHLKLILQSPQHFPRFQNFLTRYRPQLAISLKRYLDVQKAIAATKYANALAESLWPGLVAATADPEFIRKLDTAFMPLFEEALPSYVTHRMTSLVTEILVKEITGQAVPALKSLVNGLAEVYCLTDPRLPDNPIIYASSQFYAATGYGPNAVIGKNCRFLQGKGTSRVAVMRLIEALQDGQEICETMLNYRKDGSPFVNLLLIAPLHDVDGKVRYFIGAQIDINGLVEEGRGLDSFASLLARDRQNSVMGKAPPQTPMGAIAELGSFMNEHDRKILNAAAGAGSNHTGGRSDRRKMFGMNDAEDSELWPAPSLGPNGRLPGVFQNYVLVRPYPSLRIMYTAPGMLAPALVETRFLSWLRGPSYVRNNIKMALSNGQSFTAKVSWLTGPLAAKQARDSDEGQKTPPLDGRDVFKQAGGYMNGPAQRQRGATASSRKVTTESDVQTCPLWIHATPLLGEQSRVGLWMVVMVKGTNVSALQQQTQQGDMGWASGV